MPAFARLPALLRLEFPFCSLPVEQHLNYFVSSHSVVTIIRILSQSQDTARHKPQRYSTHS
ncbi:TPA: hypothetical protein ROG01_004127 [Citrobacter youngae]|nr:hypothetical protein [Citrobacter youngae]